MGELVSNDVFRWFLTLFTGVVAGLWGIYDLFNLSRLRGKDPEDPVNRDKRFGYFIGIAIGIFGVIGCLRYQGVM